MSRKDDRKSTITYSNDYVQYCRETAKRARDPHDLALRGREKRLVVPREKIPESLREICRIARAGARIFVGEIPFVETRDPTPKLTGRREMLSYLHRNFGLRTWFGMLRRMVYWQLTGKPAVIKSGTAISFHARPEEFIALARAAGLEPVRYWQQEHPNTRNNYLLRKPE